MITIQAAISYVIIAAVVIMILVMIVRKIKKGTKGFTGQAIVLDPTEAAIVRHIIENPAREDAIVAGVRSEKERLKKNA